MNMKYIIFDFDGTIGDSQALIVKTLQDTMRQRHLQVKSEAECAATIGLRLDEAFVQLFGMSAEEGMACAETYRDIFEENKRHLIVQPFPHVLATIHRLHQEGYGVSSATLEDGSLGLSRLRHRQLVEMEILARHPVLWKHLTTDSLHTLQVARLGDEHGYLAKLLILLLS